MQPDPSLYENAHGFLCVRNVNANAPPIWVAVSVRPIMQFGRLDLVVTPTDGVGTQTVWKNKVWFPNEEINLCPEAPDPEAIEAYWKAKKAARRDDDGFQTEEEDSFV